MPRKPATASVVAEPESDGVNAPSDTPDPDSEAPELYGADDDGDEPEDSQDEPQASFSDSSLNIGELLDQFAALMAQREEQIWARLEERLATIVPPSTNGHAKEMTADLAGPPGQHPTWMTMPNLETPAAPPQPRRPRMVAFIPKSDPYNPKQTTFKTWINGREIRAKRGQVMILTMGHGMALARNGHGNCVDIAAMQGSLGEAAPLPIQQNPNFAMPSDWNGLPLTDRSSIPVGR